MKTCPNCNNQCSDGSAFCMNCGASLSAIEEVVAEPAAPEPQALAAPEPQPAVAPVPAPAPQQSYGQQPPYGQQPYGQAPYGQQPYGQQPPAYAAPAMVDPYDHTAEFDAKDISDNKVYCMLCYLMGVMGIIIALLAGKDSPYAQFHVRTAIRFIVAETLVGILMLLLCWTVVALPVCGVALIALEIVKIVCFFQICGGKAKDPAILRSMKFLY